MHTLQTRGKTTKAIAQVITPQIIVQPPPAINDNTSPLVEIADLCAAVQTACEEGARSPLGYLQDGNHGRHSFRRARETYSVRE